MLLIYLLNKSPRCQYVFQSIFKEELGIAFKTTSDVSEFEAYWGEKINYSGARLSSGFFIKASPLLFENEVKKQEIQVAEKYHVKVLFPNEADDLGFDIFSAVFYMLSRYEEYLPFAADKFGRFKASDSLAFQHDFLNRPIVNIWVETFKKALQEKFDQLELKVNKFSAVLSYDVDIAYKYRGRSLGRTLGSALKDVLGFRVANFKKRIQTLLQSMKDPWDVYDDLQKMIDTNKLSSVFFFLLADKTEHDRNLDYKNPAIKNLVNKVKAFSEIGIHPSFQTSSSPEKILMEKERLENLSAEKISKSRQHYLKFKLPDTFNTLLRSGITEDYSMGFSEATGFRAGTCKPFYFYDLKNEEMSSLKMFPVICMDATFIYYLEKSPEKALMEILNLLKEVKKINGTFIPLFHNDIIGENEKWRSVHDRMVQQIKSYLKSV